MRNSFRNGFKRSYAKSREHSLLELKQARGWLSPPSCVTNEKAESREEEISCLGSQGQLIVLLGPQFGSPGSHFAVPSCSRPTQPPQEDNTPCSANHSWMPSSCRPSWKRALGRQTTILYTRLKLELGGAWGRNRSFGKLRRGRSFLAFRVRPKGTGQFI